ncbi:hypothetical protein BCR44DRAFT_36377 [Catenaria anguillulae PL171]|uniref:NodB homology domain-containing protein n=1 Tax=Catenaria anguillulae PL171 TaxID=765915 RepID=A0A1Y2HUN7_9FUNG|nr:hypothetical protein BCR44DRAFT_36377 [Catenaria anguillulae PL171]
MAFNSFRLFAAVFVVIAVYFASNDPAVEKARQKEAIRRAPVAYVPPASACSTTGQIALTFNNGVSLSHTPVVLDVLKSSSTKATFFVSPEWVGRIQLVDALLRRMLSDGHTLGFHYWGPDPRSLSVSQLRTAIIDQSTKIYNAAGVHPRFMRFPYDQLNQQVAEVARGLGLVLSFWNVDPADYQLCDSYPRGNGSTYTSQSVTDAYRTQFELFRAAGNLQSTFIGVHNDLCPIGSAIGNVVRLGLDYNYTFVDISQCLGESAKYRQASDRPEPLVASTSATNTPSTPGAAPTNTAGGSTTTASAGKSQASETPKSAAQAKASGPSVVALVAAAMLVIATAML